MPTTSLTAFLRLAVASLAISLFFIIQVPAQFMSSPAQDHLDSVVTILLASDGQAKAVGSGIITRTDGYVMTLYSLVRDAREIQVRLPNGEVYDKAEVVATDERRNVAMLRINAAGLNAIPYGTSEEAQVGAHIHIAASPTGQPQVNDDLILNGVQMADGIAGAGKGYRVLQFDTVTGFNAAGGLVLDDRGRTLGIVTTTPGISGQNIAVPISSFVGMIRSIQTPTNVTTTASYPSSPGPTPFPIPQGSVQMPQRGVTPLSPKGPGSVVVKPSSVPEILAASKTIYVVSGTVSFKPDQLVNAMNAKPEMAQWGLSFTDERDLADLILELDHVLYTYKYTFKLYSQRLGTVVATGSRIIWDGNLGAPYMAERVIEKLKAARGPEKAPAANDKKPADDKKAAAADDKKPADNKTAPSVDDKKPADDKKAEPKDKKAS